MPSELISWHVEDGRVHGATGPDGHTLYELRWDGATLEALSARLPDTRTIEIVIGRGTHPVIGACDAVRVTGESGVRAFCGHVEWSRPTTIPPLDRPGALPRGAGAALLNVLAAQAQQAGLPSVRYRGPYPTQMLFDSLQASFRVEGDVETIAREFCADAENAALAGRVAEPDVEFIPSPHAWTWPTERVCVQRRAQVERVWIDGYAFDSGALIGRSLRAEPSGDLVAAVMLGDAVVAEIARLDPQGQPRATPAKLAAAPEDLAGQPLPEEVVAVLAEVLAADGASLLAPAVRAVVCPGAVRWGDPGLALVEASADGVVIHGGLVAHLPTEPAPLLAVLVGLLGWPVRQLAQRHISDAAEAIFRR